METAIGEKALNRTPIRIAPARSRPQALATPMALRSVMRSRLFLPGCAIQAGPADTFTIPYLPAAARACILDQHPPRFSLLLASTAVILR